MIVDFSSWEEYEGLSEGSGRSEKIWLQNPTDNIVGLFKYTKSEATTEHVSEKLAELVAERIGIQCAHIDIGTYCGRKGCMSYQINRNDEILIEGVNLITKYYPYYDPEKLFDPEHKEFYSMDMILKAVSEYGLQEDIIKMMIFDSIIGNTDRHHSNWAVLQNATETKICPLYDNGSSMCFCLQEEGIKSYLGNDKMRFNSLVNTKSTSRIRIDKLEKKEPTHSDVLQYIKDRYMSSTLMVWIKTVVDNMTSENIQEILKDYRGTIISEDRAELIYRFMCEKVKVLKMIF